MDVFGVRGGRGHAPSWHVFNLAKEIAFKLLPTPQKVPHAPGHVKKLTV